MRIENLKLRNFRNFEKLELSFGSQINVLLGANAQGKTNILESISFMSTTRSFRNVEDKKMIREEEGFASIQLLFQDEKEIQISSVIYKEGKSFLLFQNPVQKTSEFIGLLSTVVFTPNELETFTNSPKTRRRMIDIEIGKTSRKYLHHLKEYNQLLKERNNYLKEEKIDKLYLETISEQLVMAMLPICAMRQEFVGFLNQNLSKKLQEISGDKQTVTVNYQSNCGKSEEECLQLFKKSEERDCYFQQTHIGIHRDDIAFYLDNQEVINYASQGQKRMIVLALKLSLIDYIKKHSGKQTILMLDDVLSELDKNNRQRLFAALPQGVQTIITTTDLDEIDENTRKRIKVYEIKENNAFQTEVKQ